MLTRSTGLVLTNMRSLRVSLLSATIGPSKRARNLGLLMGSPLHLELTQLPACKLVFCSWAGGPKFFPGSLQAFRRFRVKFLEPAGAAASTDCLAWQPMTIDVTFQASMSLFPGATVALGRAPS